ncbi:MAG: phosphotransferase [Oscillospiraceae bacterium]|nr:phosphotransferase [Oscillospiraceae bacterium]
MSIQADRIIAVRTGKTIYRDGATVLKVFDDDYSKSGILNEALNQARVEETGLPVPKLLEVTKLDGKWAIRSEFIEGKTLQRVMEEDPEHRAAHLERFVDIQREIFSREAPLLNKLKDKMRSHIAQSDLDATARYDLYTRLDAMPTHKKICHGDFNPSNIILRPDGSHCVLDWSHVTQGNASADAARSYLLFWLAGDIDAAEEYLGLFCKKTDTAKQYVQQWMPLVAASQLSLEKPQEREFLLRWVNVIDYE